MYCRCDKIAGVRCYDHNFPPIFVEKLPFFLKTNDQCLHKICSRILSKKTANFLAQCFGGNNFKISTSVSGMIIQFNNLEVNLGRLHSSDRKHQKLKTRFLY
jgi:hypothetical protein